MSKTVEDIFSGEVTELSSLSKEDVALAVNKFYDSGTTDVEQERFTNVVNQLNDYDFYSVWIEITAWFTKILASGEQNLQPYPNSQRLKTFTAKIRDKLLLFVEDEARTKLVLEKYDSENSHK